MDPLSAILAAGIAGGASLLGTSSSNAANARQASEANLWAWNEQLNQQQFNANEAAKAASRTQSFLTQSMDFNSAQAAAQRDWQGQQLTNVERYNADQAVQQRGWQTEMSNTAYQRAVRDMKAAGLNPILSAGTGGASTPSGAIASVGVPSGASGSVGSPSSGAASSGIGGATRANMADVFSPAVSNALQAANVAVGLQRASAEIKKVDAETENVKADTKIKGSGPSGSVAGVSVPVVRSLISDYGPAIRDFLSSKGVTSSSPVSSAVGAATKAASDNIPGFDSFDRIARQVMPAVEAAGRAARQTVDSWLSPGGTSLTPGNGAAPAAAKSGNLPTPDQLRDYFWRRNVVNP